VSKARIIHIFSNPSKTDQFDMNMQNVYDVKNPSMTDHFDTIL